VAHAHDRCEQCGQTDDHPKAHIGYLNSEQIRTLHHDCLSADDEQMLRDSAQARDSGPKASAIIDACKAGTKGDKLRKLIDSGELPQAEGLHEQRQLELEEVGQ
jgi:hypothetical protein